MVSNEYRNALEAFNLMRTIPFPEEHKELVEEYDPEDGETEGFSAMVFFPYEDADDGGDGHYIGSWEETPKAAVEALIETLKREGDME